MDTHSRIQELTNNSEIENSRNKSNVNISEFTVDKTIPQHTLQLDCKLSSLYISSTSRAVQTEIGAVEIYKFDRKKT